MIGLTLHPLADAEMNAQAAYYEEPAGGLGQAFLDEAEHTFERIGTAPDAGTVVGRHLRRLGLRRFPHSVIYGPGPTGLLLVALAHHRRAPDYWGDRT